MPRSRITHTSYEILALLSRKPMHGYDLGEEHANTFGLHRKILYGQVYATLQRLERDSYVQVRGVSKSAGPNRTQYQVTKTGLELLYTWVSGLDPNISVDEIERKVIVVLVLDKSASDRNEILELYINALKSSINDSTVMGQQSVYAALRQTLVEWIIHLTTMK